MYVNRFFLGVAVLVIMAVTITESFAQRTGNTGTGSTGTGSTGTSGNSRTSGNTGGGSTGSGGFVQDFSLDSTPSTNSGNSGFIGGSGNIGFIGGGGTGTANRSTMRNTTASRNNATRNNATRANMNAGNRMGGQGGGTSINTQRQVQPVYTLGFVPPTPNYARVSTTLSQRMDNTVQTGRLATVQLELSDGVAVVSGSVASEHDKKVAENMIRLQPGVQEVQSNIQLDPSVPGLNRLSVTPRRNPQPAEASVITAPQDVPLVYVFESSRNKQSVEIPVTTTPQGRPLVHVF